MAFVLDGEFQKYGKQHDRARSLKINQEKYARRQSHREETGKQHRTKPISSTQVRPNRVVRKVVRSLLASQGMHEHADVPKVCPGERGKKPHVASFLKSIPSCCWNWDEESVDSLLEHHDTISLRQPTTALFEHYCLKYHEYYWSELPVRKQFESETESTAVGDDTPSDCADVSCSLQKMPGKDVAIAGLHHNNRLLQEEVNSLQLQHQNSDREVQKLFERCETVEREAVTSAHSLKEQKRVVALLEKQRSTLQRKRRQQVAKVQQLRERLVVESQLRCSQAADVEQVRKRAKVVEAVEQHRLQLREQELVEANKRLQEAEFRKEKALQVAEEAVVRANSKIETAKANLQVHIKSKAAELADLAHQQRCLTQRLESDNRALATKEMKEGVQLQKAQANHHRQTVSLTKAARDLEKQRSLKQQKLDEQRGHREHLQRRICEDAKASAMKEIEFMKTHAEAEVATLRARAKAQLKEARREASRLRVKLLAEVDDEVAMRKQAHEELLQPTSLTLRCENRTTSVDGISIETADHELHERVEEVLSDARQPEDESCSDWEVLHELTTTVETTSVDEIFCWDIMG